MFLNSGLSNFFNGDMIKERGEDFYLEIGVPGYDRGNISVEVEGSRIWIEGKRGEKRIRYSYNLPNRCDIEKATANVENGLLTILVPKKGIKKIL